MAQRTSIAKVEGVIEVDSSIALQPFIDTAVALVDWVSSKDADSLLTAALLERIETYLSAHFYAHKDQQYTNKSTDGASASFQGQFGKGLESTQWGQTAMLMDITGLLTSLSQGTLVSAKITWGGTTSDSERPDDLDDSY